MGKSSREGKDVVLSWAKSLPMNTVLDIGAGSGTYKKLFAKNKLFPYSTWTAIEAWQPYIDNFKLTSLYNTVINSDVMKVDLQSLGLVDMTFMGDVLEHLSKQDAVTLVDQVMSMSTHAVISIPIVHWPQSERHGNPYEVHVKDDWSHSEVMETFSKYIKNSHAGEQIGVYLLSK